MSIEIAYLTRLQVAKRLQLSEKTLRNWAAQKPQKGPRCIHIGGCARYPVADFDEWERALLQQ